jgi:hypothetical protein
MAEPPLRSAWRMDDCRHEARQNQTDDWECRAETGRDRRLGRTEASEQRLDGRAGRQLDAEPADAGGPREPGSESHLDVHRPRAATAQHCRPSHSGRR